MGGIQGMQLNPGGGVLVAGDEGVGGQFSLTGGISLGLGGDPLEIGYDLIQMPINGNISRWGPKTWNYGLETGLRFDLFAVNFDALLKIGGLAGAGDASFALAPTFKVGFWKDLFGIEISPMAVSNHKHVNPGRTYIGGYLNLLWIVGVAAGFYQVAKHETDDFNAFASNDFSIPEPSFSSDSSYYHRVEKSTTVNGEQTSESYEYFGNPPPPYEGPPAPSAFPELPAPPPMPEAPTSFPEPIAPPQAQSGDPDTAAAYERCKAKALSNFAACKAIVDKCAAMLDWNAGTTLYFTSGPLTVANAQKCFDMSVTLANFGYKLQ